MSDLVDDLITVGDDRVELLESLERLVIIAQSLVNKTEVVDGLDAVSFDTNSLQEELLSSIVVFTNKEAVTFVDKGLRVISVVLDGKVSE